MSQDWVPRRYSPVVLRICALHWSGLSHDEIAHMVEKSTAFVAKSLRSSEADEILTELTRRSLDTILDVQVEAQAFAPACLHEKFRLAMQANDDRTRNVACSDILSIAGHVPARRVIIERPDPIAAKYEDMSDAEIRAEAERELGLSNGGGNTSSTPPTGTVH